MVSCGLKVEESNEIIQDSLSEKKINQWKSEETIPWEEEYEEEAVADAFIDDRTVDLTDFSSYLKKIWIVEKWDFGADYPVSLVITQIEEGYIEGYFRLDGFVGSDYFRLGEWQDKIPKFYGLIYDGTAKCEYDYRDGREGVLTIAFCGNDRIEVEVDRDEAQIYLLRPYHISDIKFRDDPTSYNVELDCWGTVTLFYANVDANHSLPWVLLLNEKGDILYAFSGRFHTGSEVLEIVIEDMNGDGLKDVEVITYFPSVPNEYRFEWFFFQLEDGIFYMGLCNGFGNEFNSDNV